MVVSSAKLTSKYQITIPAEVRQRLGVREGDYIDRARYNIATPDSIHVATALASDADAFVSEDGRLKRIVEIPVLSLAEALARVGELGSGEVHEPPAHYGARRARRRRPLRAG